MRKIFTLAAVMASTFIFAQTDSNRQPDAPIQKHTISLHGMYSEPGQIGLSYEYYKYNQSSHNKAFIANLSYGVMTYDAGPLDIDGNGFVIELGGRNYVDNDMRGLYLDNYLSYGSIKFDETTPLGKFDGTYSYFSFFSPQLGYKIKLGDVSIDPFIGVMWKIEVKGKGDVDNRNTDEWVLRGGLRIGYIF
jgi:hypothetical protein